VDPVPDPLLLRKSGSAGNVTRTSGSVDSNSDHWPTEAFPPLAHMLIKYRDNFTSRICQVVSKVVSLPADSHRLYTCLSHEPELLAWISSG
jgi:hypothetical protein